MVMKLTLKMRTPLRTKASPMFLLYLPRIHEEVANDVSINMGTTEFEEVDIAFTKQNEQKGRDLYLETVYKKPDTCDFYCPKCKACINKVLIHSRDDFDEVRCPSCFEFLRPIGTFTF